MIIVVGKWKQKIIRLAVLIVIVAVFAAAVPRMAGIFHDMVPVFSGWLQDEHPTGNPMRVEQTAPDSDFSQTIDQFVIKMQNFYLEEQE